jgi:hypothetical protein
LEYIAAGGSSERVAIATPKVQPQAAFKWTVALIVGFKFGQKQYETSQIGEEPLMVI